MAGGQLTGDVPGRGFQDYPDAEFAPRSSCTDPEHLLLETMWGGRGVMEVRRGFLRPHSCLLSRQVHRVKFKHMD
ncbi:hypothetical protein PVAP13_9KG468026 [Panicum virgatum]|uniref:Uncharacterized protein n=1 Tax=Panicum virgatum TaxID=38727 RepID=A0A8T0NRG1_PANVG|nr:hypothetical protein PVAP13_9KG468026 [Panicum virgatum]